MFVAFTELDRGCLVSGHLGHAHIREGLRLLLIDALANPAIWEHDGDHDWREDWRAARACADALAGHMSDDASEEIEAIETLNGFTTGNLHVAMVDGDLVCIDLAELD